MNNELIEKLYEQCHHRYSEHHIDLEKFAELIVRECAKVCSDVEDAYGNLNKIDIAVGAGVCASEIKEHFGVEE
jgi:hypothetical protein